VVTYDQDTGAYASRLWWLLRYLGHDAVAVLDGGWAKWSREGRSTRNGDETRPAATYRPSPHPEARLELEDVIARVGNRVGLLIDARAPERFEGRTETIDRVAGHIPGAANHFFKQNLAGDGTMLPPASLRAQFTEILGGHAPADAVMYCGSGVTACQNLLAMEHAGLPGAKLYVGSWSEWSSDPVRPIETGPAQRT
jgi:thiosulfate/3-mercaptopyruvate sulfurtransferase